MSFSSSAVLRTVPMVVVMGAIFLLSHQPGSEFARFSHPALQHLDKVVHFCIYAVLAAAVLFAFPEEMKAGRPLPVAALTLAVCLLYGIGDEFHQSFIPERSMSGGDVAADFVGSFFVCWQWWRRRMTLREEVPTRGVGTR